jgi:hypothetical protein
LRLLISAARRPSFSSGSIASGAGHNRGKIFFAAPEMGTKSRQIETFCNRPYRNRPEMARFRAYPGALSMPRQSSAALSVISAVNAAAARLAVPPDLPPLQGPQRESHRCAFMILPAATPTRCRCRSFHTSAW